MLTLKFEGQSDDTFGEYNHFMDDHDNCGSGEPIVYLLESSEGKMLVIGQYGSTAAAVWVVGVSPVDEDVPLPNWETSYELAKNGYSPVLTIHAPDDTKITCLSGEE